MIHIREVIRDGKTWGFPGKFCVGLNQDLFDNDNMVEFQAGTYSFRFIVWKDKFFTYPFHSVLDMDEWGKTKARLRIIPLDDLDRFPIQT